MCPPMETRASVSATSMYSHPALTLPGGAGRRRTDMAANISAQPGLPTPRRLALGLAARARSDSGCSMPETDW